MARDVDAALRRFDEVLDRLPGGPGARAVRSRRISRVVTSAGRRARRALIAVGVFLAALLAYALFIGPVGVVGFALAALLVPIIAIVAASFPTSVAVVPAALKTAPPALLPSKADAWLDAQRSSLPRLAAPTIDRISEKLNAIGPQLANVAPLDPLAQDVSRLLNTHLPELVERYAKVPPELRRAPDPDGGPSIEARLVDGLKTVDSELARVSTALAAGDRDAFLIQGKFLENKYAPGGVVE